MVICSFEHGFIRQTLSKSRHNKLRNVSSDLQSMHNWQHGQLHPTTKLVFVISYQMSPYSVYTDAHMAKKAEYFPKFQVGVSNLRWRYPPPFLIGARVGMREWTLPNFTMIGKYCFSTGQKTAKLISFAIIKGTLYPSLDQSEPNSLC